MASAADTESLRVSEIFFSLQGETARIGLPTIFIRLTGCPLRCRWCDTAYAFTGGRSMSIPEILAATQAYPCQRITLTGGEPLAQSAAQNLLTRLCDAGFDVSLETSGALDISGVDRRVCRVVDIKAPGSGESSKNRLDDLPLLGQQDEIKIVLADRDDYLWARQLIGDQDLGKRCPVLLSPVHGELDAAELAQWILEDGLAVRMQVQLHKLLWGNVAGR